MGARFALLLCVCVVLLLLSIEQKQDNGTSRSLWIPTLWMLINASRPLDSWFQNVHVGSLTAEMIEAGNPLDRAVLIALYLLALFTILNRGIEWSLVMRENLILTLLIIFAGVSVLWSAFPFLSIKRWIRLAGAIPIAIVVLSEKNPFGAFRSIIRRCAYVLLPFSLVLMNYYPNLGRTYSRWSSHAGWTGVTTQKNGLGQLCMISAFFFAWEFFREWRNRSDRMPKSLRAADASVLVLAVYLILRARSTTSLVGLIVAVATMLLLYSRGNNARRLAYLLMASVAIAWIVLFSGAPIVATLTLAVGKDPTFTARTSFWPVLLAEGMRHPFFGTGFGGYFNTPGNWLLETHGYNVGHNGLLDVFLEIGIVGVLLVLLFHLGLFKRLCDQLDKAFDSRVFGICFLLMSWLNNFSESLFMKNSSYIWSITVFMAIVLLRPEADSSNRDANT